ncbi:C-terminal binding protein [Microbacterium aquimaris]|uniref:C-terminal binding protein n=1 Tax=Microbacterium aquimaris TaxID=459816 RepID=A0ABU5N7W4_9MICO|nr:C-terminal binding protein [Microbacterium aquimaris]MDZ8162057.1 C-terminal binding protein [Microbacterium aquimaris]
MTQTVLLTDSDLGDRGLEVSWLTAELDVEVVVAHCTTAEDVAREVRACRPDAIVTQWAPIDAAVVAEAAPSCRIISRLGIGIDMIDVSAAEAAGIQVRNVAHYCTEEVATHAVAVALSLWRRLPDLDREVRAGRWGAAAHAGRISRLSDATLGLVGCGRIGRLVARAFEAWGTRVIVFDPVDARDGYERVGLGTLAERADIVSLHAPLVDSTRHIVGEEFLAAVRRRPIVVNTARGGLIDVDVAVAALDDGRIGGLGLDVFDVEPLSEDAAIRHAPSTIITPHAAWCSAQALPDLRRGAIDNVVEALTQPLAGNAAVATTEMVR